MTDLCPRLDSSSLIPLYYQLYELLKEDIDSRVWPPGGQMPSEPELMRTFNVSRIVVRQALSILEDDGQVVRIRGRGTFVAPVKLRQRVGGLSQNLVCPRSDDVRILILDNRTELVPRSIYSALRVGPMTDVVRITSLLSVRSVPVAIRYSFFAGDEGARMAAIAQPGRLLPASFTLDELDIQLADTAAAELEVSDACKFEADRLETLLGSTVLVVACTEFWQVDEEVRPLERARVIYRGEAMRLSTGRSSTEDDEDEDWELPPAGPADARLRSRLAHHRASCTVSQDQNSLPIDSEGEAAAERDRCSSGGDRDERFGHFHPSQSASRCSSGS